MISKSILYLEKGWNLVSFNMNKINFDQIISNKNILEIKNLKESYNSDIPKEFNTMKEINLESGYWIKSSSSGIIEFNGEINKSQIKILLKKGWNLIGYPFKLENSIINIDINNILEVKNSKFNFNSKLPNSINTLKKLNSNYGYWVKAEKNTSLILNYPFIYNQPSNESTIKGLVLIDDILPDQLTKTYEKENFCINTNIESHIDLPWIPGNDKIKVEEIKSVLKSINKIKFSVYYGKWNNEINSLGAYFHDDFKILKGYEGKLKINPSNYDSNNKFFEIQIGERLNDKIIFNISDKIIIFKFMESYCFLKNINFEKINLDDENNNTNLFLSDYDLERIYFDSITIQKNNQLLKINSINSRYNINKKCLQINLIDDESKPIIFFIKKFDDKSKKCLFKISSIDNNEEYSEKLILNKKVFEVNSKNNNFKINLIWRGDLNIRNFNVANKFLDNTEYFYWYNLNKINFENFYFNDVKIKYNINQINKDYMILSFYQNNKKYKLFIIKSKSCVGCVEVSIEESNSKITNFYNSIEALYNNQIFYLDSFKINLSWKGIYDETGYSIKNTLLNKQREIGSNLNTYEIFTHNNFTFKIHYYIGLNEQSIDINTWNTYDNYIKTVKQLLGYCIDYAIMFNLKLPLNDDHLIKNGGGPGYDVYITNYQENSSIKFDDYYHFTSNNNDVNTYLIISNKLDYNKLKCEIFNKFFQAIIGSYNWNISKWIYDGLSSLFEYILNDNDIETLGKYIPLFLENQNLSIANYGNAEIDSNGFIYTINSKEDNFANNLIHLDIKKIYTYDKVIDFENNIIPKLEIKSSNNVSINIKDVNIIEKNGENILRIILDSNRQIKFMKFLLYINSNLVKDIDFYYKSKTKGTLLFFYYLLNNFDNSIFNDILKISNNLKHYQIIQNYISSKDSTNSFNKVLLNFWTAVNIMSNSPDIDNKFKLKNSEDIKNLINIPEESIIISNENNTYQYNNLENTGSKCYNLVFDNILKGNIQIYGGFDSKLIFTRIIVQYQNGKYHFVDPGNNFDIEINNSVFKIKLLIVASRDFIDNEKITIKTINSDLAINFINNPNLFDLKINVLKK